MTTRNLLAIKSQVAPQNEFKVVDIDGNISINLGSDLVDTNVREDLASTTDVAKGAAMVGYKHPGTGAVARTLYAKAQESLSVTDFGAVGDGVADDVAAILAAIAAAPAGGEVTFPDPSAYYSISDEIVLDKDIALIGLGPRVQIRQSNAAKSVIKLAVSASNRNIQLRNLDLRHGAVGLNLTSSDGTARALGRGSMFQNLHFGNSGTALKIASVGVIDVLWENINIENATDYGLFAQFDGSSAASTNQAVFNKLRALGTAVTAIHLENTHADSLSTITLISPTVEMNSGRGIYTKRCQAVLIDPWFEQNGSTTGGPDIELEGVSGTSSHAVAELIGGTFQTASAAQSNVRVKFAGVDGRARLLSYGTYWKSSDIIDGNNLSAECDIAIFGAKGGTPTISNYDGKRLIYNRGLIVSDTRLHSLTPAQITTTQNNYSPGDAAFLRLSSDADRTITGFAGGSDGRLLTLINVGSFDITLTGESGSSIDANRITLNGGLSTVMAPGTSLTLIYDGTTSRWRVYSKQNELLGQATLDFPLTASGSASDLTMTVNGADDGDGVILTIPNAAIVGGAAGFYAWVSAADTVTVRFWNLSGGDKNPASGTFRVVVQKR